jgi:hypothetical protein
MVNMDIQWPTPPFYTIAEERFYETPCFTPRSPSDKSTDESTKF